MDVSKFSPRYWLARSWRHEMLSVEQAITQREDIARSPNRHRPRCGSPRCCPLIARTTRHVIRARCSYIRHRAGMTRRAARLSVRPFSSDHSRSLYSTSSGKKSITSELGRNAPFSQEEKARLEFFLVFFSRVRFFPPLLFPRGRLYFSEQRAEGDDETKKGGTAKMKQKAGFFVSRTARSLLARHLSRSPELNRCT